MIFAWICLNPILVLAVPNEKEKFVPIQPPPPPSQANNDTKNNNHLLCTPFGACEPCPNDAMNEPFCQPFGNRRLMHCVNSTSSSASDSTKGGGASSRPGTSHFIREIPAWESCGRIPAKERADFYEFIACNVLFAAVALGVLLFRERRLRMGRARMLAARIGIGVGGVMGRR
ncbi:hypothetical protein GALMADRAFT_228849 [Galerina marginata CBS 339.88]|uniref:Uncharacterized protein n=1 Tax=Galerina marginata (strain CBS 339.88) TaxID=685588 RepID=A0A067SY06_GALM3|nr:hypothetical protein GALMADRAFT_228849 [Galerina marginata CBS 339.88]